MGYFSFLADPCIWMRRVDDRYEYIAVYIDDLAIASKDPADIIRVLTDDYKFKLKGTGPIEFHLGCDFFRDEEGVLCLHLANTLTNSLHRMSICLDQNRRPTKQHRR